MVRVDCRRWRLMVSIHGAVDLRPGLVGVWGCPTEQLRHESYVGDGQTESFYAGKSFFVSEGGHLAAQFVEGLVQVEHPSAFADIGSSPLSHASHPAAGFLWGAGGPVGPAICRRTLGNQGCDLRSLPQSCEVGYTFIKFFMEILPRGTHTNRCREIRRWAPGRELWAAEEPPDPKAAGKEHPAYRWVGHWDVDAAWLSVGLD